MDTQPQASRLLSLPSETRLQIYQHAIPTETELCFCPCINYPTRASETAVCLCYQTHAPSTTESPPDETPLSLIRSDIASPALTPKFLIGTEELLSSLPLTCRQIFTDTHSITQPPKHLTLCSAPCLTSLLSAANPTQLALITKITIAIDLRIFRPAASSGHLASFRDIWKCIYNTRIVVDRSIHKFYSGPSVERMNADIIAPELDFYPLVIKTGRPFDCKEMVFQRFWCDYSKGEERLAEFMRVLGKNQREMRGLGEGVPRLEGRDRIEGRGRAKASASRQVDSG